ncbi:MAG: hypothetical protein CMN05_06455 [Roseibacillus sp.]|jgi:hypothetical protein|nr:hypothetical protein [Roseibacillus sp.]MBP34628.1 hypothetical protein [Roseibacillus sp.]|tara:strand:+ start:138 stop:341 length:204 start_codon:yes stop_codon:yes gene_type:complete
MMAAPGRLACQLDCPENGGLESLKAVTGISNRGLRTSKDAGFKVELATFLGTELRHASRKHNNINIF